MILVTLFFLFFRIGLFTFGGGLAIVPMIQTELVSRGYLTLQQSIDLVAISQITPGPFSVNAATFAGMQVAGVPGALAATFGMMAPSLVLAILVARFFFSMNSHPTVKSVLYGIRPVVLGLIGGSFFTVSWATLLGAEWSGFTAASLAGISLDVPVLVIAAVAAVVMLKTKFSPILLILLSGAIGALFLH